MHKNQFEKVIVLSNISVEPFFVPNFQRRIQQFCVNPIVTVIPYQQYHETSYHTLIQEADTIIVWLNIESIFPEIHCGGESCSENGHKSFEMQDLCINLTNYLKAHSNAKIFWILFEDFFLHRAVITGHHENRFIENLNNALLLKFDKEIVFIDLKYLIAQIGVKSAFSIKDKFRWNFPYSKELTHKVIDEICNEYFIENGISKKCLVLDCDNVLWGGIISEDGIENIRLGNSGLGYEYQEFQRFVLSLYHRGVILTLCSKNDLSDVINVFRQHTGMILKEEHIAFFAVNWNNKPDNIKEISAQLNIGTESMVFVDDSPLEIDAVNTMLPEVTTILYDRETMYENFSCFHLKENPDFVESAKRAITYRTESYRTKLRSNYENYDDYLSALGMQLDIHEVIPGEYGRVAELTQRTNKCTNGVRCTVTEIKTWLSSRTVQLYSVNLSDKFSDLGLVGVIGVRNHTVEVFSLSCRAMGRNIESQMLEFVCKRHLINNFTFIDTGKNENIKSKLQDALNKKTDT